MAANRVDSTSRERLQVFYEEWIVRLRSLFDELVSVSTEESDDGEPRRREVIERTVAHYRTYFEGRRLVAGEDVFVVFAAPWLSAIERSYVWAGGIKPALIIRLAERGVGREGLAPEQVRRMELLRAETGRGEREVAEALAAVQESVAAPPLVGLMRGIGQTGAVDGMVNALDAAMDRLRAAMGRVLESADVLRATTMRRVLEVLPPAQAVKFLVAAVEFQLRLRQWGLQRDAQRRDQATNANANANGSANSNADVGA